MKPRVMSVEQLVQKLDSLRRVARPGAIAFDGDGTLWSGDVSEDVFTDAVERGLLRDSAEEAMIRAAEAFGVESHGTVSEVAARIFAAYRQQRYPEREVCEMMTWCYAGWTVDELVAHTRRTLQRAAIGKRLNRALEPIIGWARASDVRCIVISASPQSVVEVAASFWQFSPADIAASRPVLDGALICPRMNGAVPYASGKCEAGRALLGEADWLASFGDNVYDTDMMQIAQLGVAVTPKPALAALLPDLANVVVLG